MALLNQEPYKPASRVQLSASVLFREDFKGQPLQGRKKLMKYLIKANCALFLVNPTAAFIYLFFKEMVFLDLSELLYQMSCVVTFQ